MKKIIILILSISFLCSNAQTNNDLFQRNHHINTADSNKLFLEIENSNFMKNNEYFGKFGVGFTSFGYLFSPKLIYHPSKNTKMEAGLFVRQYFGQHQFHKIAPWYRFQYQFHPKINFVLGNLYGGLDHDLIEPLYQFDRHYNDHPETGVQLLIDFHRFEADIWMDWERFIMPGDTFKEQISSGLVAKLQLLDPNKQFNLYVPYQYTMFHHGGQVDASEAPLETLVNNATGLCSSYKLKDKWVKSISLNQYFLFFKDASHKPNSFYEKGSAFYTYLQVRSSIVDAEIGYWNADQFISPKGEHLFQSVSYVWDVQEEKRELITAKAILHHQIANNIALNLRFDCYYDILNLPHEHIKSRFEFAYGIHLIFDREFFFKKLEHH